MPSRKNQTIGTKISEEKFNMLTLIAEREGTSVSGLLKIFVDDLINGDIVLENGSLKKEDYLDEALRYREMKVDSLLDAFEKRGYPAEATRKAIETMAQNVMDSNKYNPRRAKTDEWGC